MINTYSNKWPELNYSEMSESLKTLHLWVQIVGKVRLKLMPWQNHSWHTTLYISPNGFTTQSIPYDGGSFQIDFDFINHFLSVKSTYTKEVKMELYERSVASFYKEFMSLLNEINLKVHIHDRPNELEDNTPFHKNEQNSTYDKEQVEKLWIAFTKVNCVFTAFRGDFLGKCSPVHLFWGAFDLAVSRFSGEKAPLHPGGMPNMPLKVMQEAYSHEVSSAGFWAGSDEFPFPAFYSYCYPTPEEFGKQKVLPDASFWSDEMGEYFLKYEDVQKADDPDAYLLQFLETSYAAAANTLSWNRSSLEAGENYFK